MNLPWYYLGDLATVLYGESVAPIREGDPGCGPPLHRDRVQLNPGGSTSHPAIQFTRDVVETSERAEMRKPGCRWGLWPSQIQVKVRKEMPGTLRTSGGDVQRAPNDFIIGPSRLILPWPFDESVKGSEDDFEVDSFDLESDYDPSQDTIGNLLLKAGDDLVDGIGVRDAIGLRRPMNPMSRNVLIRWVQEKLGHATYGLPDAIQVESLDRLPDTTHLRISEDALTLVLGASRVGTSSLFAENKVYEQWPCGAFEP